MKLWDVELMKYELPASLEAAKVASSIVFRSPREILGSAREEGIDQVCVSLSLRSTMERPL